ncbi:3-hydroxy-fatty acyl-ACP dehydratase [Yersinia nurmii]|uniref:Dehydratase n=1 Tax=Yersinia nurmii TaxID=685706 RepID=A0AAW7JTB9_9GAMM|nr:3-hydroxy-fatty acyl-ACP dehydratase [Yersinia nurmii]MDN0086182.1 3-hydroxy-fatty acyl-ACP dehydratase [Yersinia nurmii]CND82188.1 putative dehydratase [Yersinia nurmii]
MPEYLPAGNYLPHHAPMMLLEEVVAVEEERVHCRVKVTEQGVLAPFLTAEGHLPGWFALELMAQTVGVWSGWHSRQRGERVASLGMLLGARALRSQTSLIKNGNLLDITMVLLMQDEKFGSFEGEISSAGQVLATARLNTYQPDQQELKQLFQRDEME